MILSMSRHLLDRWLFATAVGFALLVQSAFGETLQVPATANPWLAGMMNGATARRGDSAPDQSPVLVTGIHIEGGATYEFSASGSANHGSTLPLFPPDGEDLISHYLGAENGIANITAPFVSVIGVFLGSNQPDEKSAPGALDFREPADRDYPILAPQLKQPFFIGDGLTSSGAVQQVIAPSGATRLFVGVMDEYRWADNEGAFTMQVTRADSSPPIYLALRPSLHPTDAEAVAVPARLSAAPAVTESGVATNVAFQIHAFTAIELVWPSEPSRVYQVQWTPSLKPPEWANLGPVISGSGSELSIFDSTRMHPQGFYRVQIVQ
jgi:hypothetical protein